MIRRDRKTHALQLHAQLVRRFLGAVGEEHKLFVILDHPIHKFGNAVKQLVAVIDHAVHIADEACFSQNTVHN